MNMNEATQEILRNYAESKTCEHCVNCEGSDCSEFDINVPNDFTCLSFEGVADDI